MSVARQLNRSYIQLSMDSLLIRSVPHTLLHDWLCRVSRLRGATQMYMVQNLGCAAAAAAVLPLLQPAPPAAPWLLELLIALSVVCGSLSGIGAAGSNWIVEREWPKGSVPRGVLCTGGSECRYSVDRPLSSDALTRLAPGL